MPTTRGITVRIETRIRNANSSSEGEWKVVRFPEYPHTLPQPIESKSIFGRSAPAQLPAFLAGSSKAVELMGSPPVASDAEIAVYIPVLRSTTSFRIAYAFTPPYPEGIRFEYKLFFNKKYIVSGDITPQQTPQGHISKTIRETETGISSNKKSHYEELSFEFIGGKGLFKTVAEEGGLIEVQWFRIEGSKPSEPKGLVHTKTVKSKYGIGFNSLGTAFGVKHRDYLLVDPLDKPWATFKFYYRSWSSLREHSIVVDDEYNEATSEAAPIGDSIRSLVSFFAELAHDEAAPSPAKPAGLVISAPYNFSCLKPSTQAMIANGIPVGPSRSSSVSGNVVHKDISKTVQGRIVAQSNANNQTRVLLQDDATPLGSNAISGAGARDARNKPMPITPRPAANNNFLTVIENTDRQSMASLTPSLKECVDNEDDNGDGYVVGLATAVDLAVPRKRRPGHGSVKHTGISGQFAGLRARDDSSSVLEHSSDMEAAESSTPRLLDRSAGIYQHANTGLPHYGSQGLSSQPISGQASSEIDEDFAVSGHAPPTRGIMFAPTSRPPPPPPFLTPRENFALTMSSSPIKSPPPGVEYPVDSPGSAGFPVIYPEDIEAYGISPEARSMPGLSPDNETGSVVYQTPRTLRPRAGYLDVSPALEGMGRQFSNSSRIVSSPLAEIDELQLNGQVKRRVDEYESPRDSPSSSRSRSLAAPLGRVAVPADFAREEDRRADAMPKSGVFLGKLTKTPSKMLNSERTMSKAKHIIANIKSHVQQKMPRTGDGSNGEQLVPEQDLAEFDDRSFAMGDEDIFVSSPVNRVSKDMKKLKMGSLEGPANGVVDARVAEAQTSSQRSRPKSEDDPDHPLRRRKSTVSCTAQDWIARDVLTPRRQTYTGERLLDQTKERRAAATVDGEKKPVVRKDPGTPSVPSRRSGNPLEQTTDAVDLGAHTANPLIRPSLAASQTEVKAVPVVDGGPKLALRPKYADRAASLVAADSSLQPSGSSTAQKRPVETLFFDREAVKKDQEDIKRMVREANRILERAPAWRREKSANIVEAVRGRAKTATSASAAPTVPSIDRGNSKSAHHRNLANNLVGGHENARTLDMPSEESIINPLGPLRHPDVVLHEIRMYNGYPLVMSERWPRIHESQLNEYRAKPVGWLPDLVKVHYSRLYNPHFTEKGQHREAYIVDDIKQEIREALGRGQAPAADGPSASDLLHVQPLPSHSAGPVSAAANFPIRHSSLHHGMSPLRAQTRAEPLVGATAPGPTPALRRTSVAASQSRQPKDAVIAHTHPAQTTLELTGRARSDAEADVTHGHAVQTPVVGIARLITIHRHPSQMRAADAASTEAATSGYGHEHPDSSLTDRPEARLIQTPVRLNANGEVFDDLHDATPPRTPRRPIRDDQTRPRSSALASSSGLTEQVHAGQNLVRLNEDAEIFNEPDDAASSRPLRPPTTGELDLEGQAALLSRSECVSDLQPIQTPASPVEEGNTLHDLYDATPPGTPQRPARREQGLALPQGTPSRRSSYLAPNPLLTESGVAIRDASNAANIFRNAPFPSSTFELAITSPDTPVPGGWPKEENEKEEQEHVLSTPGKYDDLYEL